jgi:hypothetical protein
MLLNYWFYRIIYANNFHYWNISGMGQQLIPLNTSRRHFFFSLVNSIALYLLALIEEPSCSKQHSNAREMPTCCTARPAAGCDHCNTVADQKLFRYVKTTTWEYAVPLGFPSPHPSPLRKRSKGHSPLPQVPSPNSFPCLRVESNRFKTQ